MSKNGAQESGGTLDQPPDSVGKGQDNNMDGNPHNYLTEERFVSIKTLFVCENSWFGFRTFPVSIYKIKKIYWLMNVYS